MDDLAFLFDEATWRAEGCFIDADGTADSASGVTEVRHGTDVWTIEGEMKVESDEIGEPIRNVYRVRPFTGEDSATSWTSENPRLGRLEGTFSVVADSIVSVYGSEEGEARGTECLRRVDPHTYEARGTLTIADERVTSWALTLERVESPDRSSETGDSKAETRTTRRSRNE